MERRQRWLEAQFRRHDECLSKIAKQLQVLQDFISLNFDSYRQYALEREREERINHLAYGNIDKPHTQQGHSYHQASPPAHSQYPSRLTPLPPPDHYLRHIPSSNPGNSESEEYDDGDMMDPAPGESDPPPTGMGVNQMPIVAVDLSTERRRYQQTQEPNSTTVTDYAAAAYYGLTSRCGEEMVLPDSGLIDEGPTDLSVADKKCRDERELEPITPPPFQGNNAVAEGSILGGILTSHMQPKIKAEIKEEDEPSHCYVQYPRSRTASTDSASKDKEYSSQGIWSAGTMTAVMGGPGSTCSADEISEHSSSHRSKSHVDDQEITIKTEKTSDLQNYLMSTETPATNSGIKPEKPTKGGRGRKRRVSHDSGVVPSSSASTNRRSPSTTTSSSGEHSASTSSSGKKGNSNNASKQCRFCGKTFQWLHSVKTHERLHTGIKPYGCKICGARFTQNGNLKVHAKTCVEKHAESYRSRNVHICSVCTEMFSDKDALMDHQKSHDRMQWTIKEKTCQLCGEVFQKRSFLLEHEKVHIQDRTFLNSLGIEAENAGGTTTTSSSAGSVHSGTSEK